MKVFVDHLIQEKIIFTETKEYESVFNFVIYCSDTQEYIKEAVDMMIKNKDHYNFTSFIDRLVSSENIIKISGGSIHLLEPLFSLRYQQILLQIEQLKAPVFSYVIPKSNYRADINMFLMSEKKQATFKCKFYDFFFII
jgi:hypothetical protein